ncbi:acid phosphatase 1 [Andrographis paniculata]|uniref:acid phosphatase 1 n=1 Tax=Andrographis paniculata TaxID=175694 RepID=UPI0021E791D4|nr:acid phosphatase 1 [Andrographis paniculata]
MMGGGSISYIMMRQSMLLLVLAVVLTSGTGTGAGGSWWRWGGESSSSSYCLSWRMGVEANNIRAWRTVPDECQRHVEAYIAAGQYQQDLALTVGQVILAYVDAIAPSLPRDGFDAWILDVDDTCISNLRYYRGKRYGCDPFDPQGFKAWASRAGCPAIPDVLRLFYELVRAGFKVFLVTGRDEETLGEATLRNLHDQGFLGYHRLILRSSAYKGLGAAAYKSEMRKQLVGEGYRIWGNVGDQWSDLQGDCPGNRTFKLPNPIYFVP